MTKKQAGKLNEVNRANIAGGFPAESETMSMESQQLESSQENGKKLDRLIQLIEGTGPHDGGMLSKVDKHEVALYGEGDHPGILTKVNIMWRVHVWLLCSVSGGLGAMLMWVFKK